MWYSRCGMVHTIRIQYPGNRELRRSPLLHLVGLDTWVLGQNRCRPEGEEERAFAELIKEVSDSSATPPQKETADDYAVSHGQRPTSRSHAVLGSTLQPTVE